MCETRRYSLNTDLERESARLKTKKWQADVPSDNELQEDENVAKKACTKTAGSLLCHEMLSK